jgi:hypothetical protein
MRAGCLDNLNELECFQPTLVVQLNHPMIKRQKPSVDQVHRHMQKNKQPLLNASSQQTRPYVPSAPVTGTLHPSMSALHPSSDSQSAARHTLHLRHDRYIMV